MGLTIAEIAYAAGILDGEGSISMARVSNKSALKANSAYWRVVIATSNCDKDLIEWLHARWPGNCKFNMNKGPNKRSQHRHVLYGKNASKFLIDIQPYSIIKSNRIKWALEVNAIQARPRKPAERYPVDVKERLIEIRQLFDEDKGRSLSARNRIWDGV